MGVDWEYIRGLVNSYLNQNSRDLQRINQTIHGKPEVAFHEFHAHKTICDFLETRAFAVQRKTYGLETSFEATSGSDGRLVVFCAEYDALPSLGHACGHNLVATSSLGAFLAAAHVLKKLGLSGRLRLLGTPAEEGGGGKVKLIKAGAFGPPGAISAAIMAHPVSRHGIGGVDGVAALDLIASVKFRVEFRGRSAHAAGEPWNGINALDAAVAAYNNVSLMRQQMRPDERVHGVFEVGGTVPNVIPDYARMNWYARAPTTAQAERLQRKLFACLDAATAAAGCTNNFIPAETYKHVISNPTLCDIYAKDMAYIGRYVLLEPADPFAASTDMGNVSHEVPSFHGAFSIPTDPDAALHSIKFAVAAGTHEAHTCAVESAKGMAMLALRVILDEVVAGLVRRDFDQGNVV
ncbi:hypothetical protein E4U21_002571 [Claviceps maximensis]|nr:hypothetical protein E4U21_002571 [Claviceps maximensis]